MFLLVVKPIVKTILRIVSIVIFILTVFAAYGGRFTPDFFTLPSILCLAAPYLAVTTLVISILWFIGCKWITGGLGILSLIASWSALASITPLNFSKPAKNPANTFSLLTYNIVHGVDQQQEDAQTGHRSFEYVLHSGADIVCLQEVRDWNDPEEIPNFTRELRDSLRTVYPYWAGAKGLSDTKVLSKFPVMEIRASSLIENRFDPYCYTFYRIDVKGRPLTLVNIHFTSYDLTDDERRVVTDVKNVDSAKESMREMKGTIGSKMSEGFRKRKVDAENLCTALRKIDGPLILCGDFNDVPESYSYRLLRGEGLEDAYAQTGFGPMITYNKHLFWFHIDQILYRGAIRPLSVKKGSLKSSDHYPLTAEFEFRQ